MPISARVLTIYGSFARQYDDNQLQTGVRVLQVTKHWLNLVGSRCILAKTRLSQYRHPRITRDLLQLLRKAPTSQKIMIAGEDTMKTLPIKRQENPVMLQLLITSNLCRN